MFNNVLKVLKILFFISNILLYTKVIFSQDNPIKLWKGLNIDSKYKTTIYIKSAPDSINSGVTAIVCPGGSYAHLMGIATEGFEVAEWLNKQGINAVVLKYRVGKDGYHHPSMIEDLQATIYHIRKNAEKLKFDGNKLGVIGFSAGGHLSLSSAMFQNNNFLENVNIFPENLAPNFIVAVYPVISMQDGVAHERSRKNLLGNNVDQDQKDKFSIEMNVSTDFPPVLLVAAEDDPVVYVKNSLLLNDAMLSKKVKGFKFLLYKTGGHGFGLNDELGGEAAAWKYSFLLWLKEQGILS